MNYFTKSPTDGSHMVSCHHCSKGMRFAEAFPHGGAYWCRSCAGKGKHMEGHGFGPVRFSGKDNIHTY